MSFSFIWNHCNGGTFLEDFCLLTQIVAIVSSRLDITSSTALKLLNAKFLCRIFSWILYYNSPQKSECSQSSLYAKTTWIEFLSGIFAQDLLLFTWILNVGISDLWNICWNGILSHRIVLMSGCLLRKLNCDKRFSFPDRSDTNNRPLPIKEFLLGPHFKTIEVDISLKRPLQTSQIGWQSG